jgi:hypothetical protein
MKSKEEILRKCLDVEHIHNQKIRYAVYDAMEEYANQCQEDMADKDKDNGFILSPNIPTELMIIEKSLEFDDVIGINKFVAGAMWIKSMLLVRKQQK